MKKKFVKHSFSTPASDNRITKEVDGKTLVALAVLPASPFNPAAYDARSGITFVYDALSLIASHKASGRKLPVDIEHSTEYGGDDTRARGWVLELTTNDLEPGIGLVPGVLYGWVELTMLGTAELGDKQWGFTSAVTLGSWLDDKTCQFTRIKSLALTNNPATDMPMTFTAEDAVEGGYTEHTQLSTETVKMEKILQLLGLTAEATEAEVVAALEALTASASTAQAFTTAGFTAADATTLAAQTATVTTLTAQVETLQTSLTAAQTELNTFKAAQAEATAVTAVDAAVTAGKFPPSARDALLAQARADIAAFNTLAAAMPSLTASAVATQGAQDETFGLSVEQIAHCKTHGFDLAIYAKNLRASA